MQSRLSRFLSLIAMSTFLAGCGGGGGGSVGVGSFTETSVPPVSGTVPGDVAPRGYIVTLRDDASPARFTRDSGIKAEYTWQYALNGFAAALTDEQLAALRGDPRVLEVGEDLPVQATAQTAPPGVRRVGAGVASPGILDDGVTVSCNSAAISVAVIDTGVQGAVPSSTQPRHPDLNGNVLAGVTYVKGTKSANDDNGHGTHVAGIIAAQDNTLGVVGVAPSMRIVPVKVLDRSGTGNSSQTISGINWCIANRKTFNIKVINMSLGGSFSSQVNAAVQSAINNGITVVVAAGNESRDVSQVSPASAPQAITVSAMSDYDGLAGGTGGTRTFQYGDGRKHGYPDDGFARVLDDTSAIARFSNFGAGVDITAPGTDVTSTYPTYLGDKTGYKWALGTSQATPHVAGAAALAILRGYAPVNPASANDVALVTQAVLSRAWAQSSTGGYAFQGVHPVSGSTYAYDPDSTREPLLNVSAFLAP